MGRLLLYEVRLEIHLLRKTALETGHELLTGEDGIRYRHPGLLQLPGKLRHLWYIHMDGLQLLDMAEHFAWCAVHDDLTTVHNDDSICIDRFLHIVGDEDDRHAHLLIQLPDGLDDLLATTRIEHRRRLIENDGFRKHRHRTGDRDTLLLPATETVRGLHTVRHHVDGFERTIHTCPDLVGRYADVLRAEADILLDDGCDDLVIRILEDHAGFLFILRIAATDEHGSLTRQVETVNQLCQGRLAGTVVAEHTHEAPGLDGQVDVIQGPGLLNDFIVLICADVVIRQM